MPRSLALPSIRRVMSGLACGLALAPAAACHQQSSVPGRPSTADRPNVGYGQQAPEHAGGAVQSATAEELKNLKVKQVEDLLVGRFPGVRVHSTRTGGFSIRLRGGNTPGNGQPLYVIDGMPVEVQPDRGLDWLEPADIARIDVLKNPAETSMYGGRGAYGVILITTKLSNERRSRP